MIRSRSVVAGGWKGEYSEEDVDICDGLPEGGVVRNACSMIATGGIM